MTAGRAPRARRPLSFERDDWDALDLIPLTVRRKLDLAERKLSLDGWRRLSRGDRRALRDADDGAFARALAASSALVSPHPLPEGGPPWRSSGVPEPVRARLAELRASLDDDAWSGLDDEARYVLWKLAERARDPSRFEAAVRELGIGLIPTRAGDKGSPS